MNRLPERLDLNLLGIDATDITHVERIHEKHGNRLYRVRCDMRSVVIKWFGDTNESTEICSYALLKELGIPTLCVLGQSHDAIAIEDLADNKDWRLATDADIELPDVGRAVAEWYLRLHEAGRERLTASTDPPRFLRREEDALDADTILAIGNTLGLTHLHIWRLCANHIEPLKLAIGSQTTTFTYNDFHWSNMAVTRLQVKPSSAVMFDFHLLGIGMPASDYRNVLGSLCGPAANTFVEVYGPPDEQEVLLDAPVSVLVGLKEATQRQKLPSWAEYLIQSAINGELEHSLHKALETV